MLFNLITHQRQDNDNIYLYIKNPFKSMYQLLIKGREKVGIEKLRNSKAFLDYSEVVDDAFENLEDYNLTKKRRVLIVFDDMIADMESDKQLSLIVTELFLAGRKFNISLVLRSKSYFKVPKTIRLIPTHYFIMEIPNKRYF